MISDSIYLMLLVEPYFKTFTDKQVIDAATSIQTILALSADSREDVDELVDKALAAGGAAPKGPEDHGFMYQRSFTDPDGAPVRDPLDGPERPAADVTATVPNRITWAVDLLDLQPHHRVMEIGCGPGSRPASSPIDSDRGDCSPSTGRPRPSTGRPAGTSGSSRPDGSSSAAPGWSSWRRPTGRSTQ